MGEVRPPSGKWFEFVAGGGSKLSHANLVPLKMVLNPLPIASFKKVAELLSPGIFY